jgi:hypothetical protein
MREQQVNEREEGREEEGREGGEEEGLPPGEAAKDGEGRRGRELLDTGQTWSNHVTGKGENRGSERRGGSREEASAWHTDRGRVGRRQGGRSTEGHH